MEMKISYCVLLILLLAPVALYRVAGELKVVDGTADTKGKGNGNESVNGTVNPVKNGKDVQSTGGDSVKQSDLKDVANGEQKKDNDTASKDEQKQNKGSDSKSDKGTERVKHPVCDSSSNSCIDDAKTLVACLRVLGNESPERSLLIQNKGKGPLSVTISAPDLVHLEKNKIQLQENEVTELNVPVKGLGYGQFIMLTAGHGDCRLDISDQSIHGNKKPGGHPEFTFFNFTWRYNWIVMLFLGALAMVASVLMCLFLRRHVAKKAPKYQMLDMELPVSHGSKHEPAANERWDDSWEDNWDDEEAPTTPSFQVTPSHSTKSIASRKHSKAGWKD
ncbi:hypothetical protein F511_08991 [Dorcoceras hygrometricum]|uniref:DUF7356 domain-containing protein n=1 Tax=Dorcoceras hygrometricum TaxID=472368 RepID=A0A2Z7BL06_9LAMI|nr:hypothetical protein F511_08991 [Dorcoceras hygrometricum]